MHVRQAPVSRRTGTGFQIRYQSEATPVREMQVHARDKGSQHPELRITFG